MPSLPRLAVGSVYKNTDCRLMLWALLDVLQGSGAQVQSFVSQSKFIPNDAAHSITGQCYRHLDSWLTSAEQCRRLFSIGARCCTIAVVDGTFDTSALPPSGSGGRLVDLCEWLDLPRLGVVNVRNLGDCLIPVKRPAVDALLVDGVEGPEDRCRWQTSLEALWGLPVIGALDSLPSVRDVTSRLRDGSRPTRAMCRTLGTSLLRHLDLDRLMQLANGRDDRTSVDSLLRPVRSENRLNVAVAFDEVYHCHFADMLDLLEMSGSTITDFSPLRDESLPPHIDIVYLGCGNPEFYADSLAANHCMHTSLRRHVNRGGPVYAEGAGMALLCQYLRLPGGRTLPMAGVLPVDIRLEASGRAPDPVELTLRQACWLGRRRQVLRGYVDSTCAVEGSHRLANLAEGSSQQVNLLGHRNVICSQLQLNFATQPELLERFYLRQKDSQEIPVS